MTAVRAARRLLSAAIVLAFLAGCGEPTDTKSRGGNGAAGGTGPALTVRPGGSGTASTPASPDSLTLAVHTIPEAWAKTSGIDVATDGTEIVWSAINGFDRYGQPYLADVVRFVPGQDDEPRIIYRHPDRDSAIVDVAVRHGRYAFLEDNARLGRAWRLWALERPDATAALLDADDAADVEGLPTPSVALTDDRVVWTAVHRRGGVLTWELRSARFDGSDPQLLLASPRDGRRYFSASASPDGRHVLFGTVEDVTSGFRFRIHSLDLTQPGASPVRLGDSDEATAPVTNGSRLVWSVVDGDVANWTREVMVAEPSGTNANHVALPAPQVAFVSLGRRFIAYDTLVDLGMLAITDTKTNELVVVEKPPKDDGVVYQRGWTVVAGDLLVFRRVTTREGGTPPQVCWAFLPPP